MSFASFIYLIFLALVLLLYYLCRQKWRNAFLLFASFFFYAVFGLGFAGLMLITSFVTYISSHYCYHASDVFKKKLYFYSGLLFDLLIFILFKYLHLIDMELMSWPNWSAQQLLIPIGISFYTFKTVGYCIDIYKGKYKPEESFLYYALSVGFFPQLIAGPIEKSRVISAQLKTFPPFDLHRIIEGLKLICWGMFKKIVIADSIALILNPYYSNIVNYEGLDLILISFAFIYQVYTDFSGYSDIAIGSARCFGIDLPANFNKPFFSESPRKFWGRWHASMTAWLREYIYIPLGGNRVPLMKELSILLLVFLITGLWHGASLNYILFGLCAYLFLLLDIITKKIRFKFFKAVGIPENGMALRVMSYISITFMVTVMCVFFRPGSLHDSFYILENVFQLHSFNLKPIHVVYLFGIIILFELMQFFQMSPLGHCFERPGKFSVRSLIYLFVIFSLILFSSKPDVTFQYFQF